MIANNELPLTLLERLAVQLARWLSTESLAADLLLTNWITGWVKDRLTDGCAGKLTDLLDELAGKLATE